MITVTSEDGEGLKIHGFMGALKSSQTQRGKKRKKAMDFSATTGSATSPGKAGVKRNGDPDLTKRLEVSRRKEVRQDRLSGDAVQAY